MFQRVYQHALSGAYIFNMFIAKTRGFGIDQSVLSGQAFYRTTQRRMIMKASFVSLYTRYAASHITWSMEMGMHTIMLTLLSRYGRGGIENKHSTHVEYPLLLRESA